MPKNVVIAGGGRNVGKTLLAHALGRILPDCAVIKLGVHHARPEKNQLFFERGTSYSQILEKTSQRSYLVIESGAILDDPDICADLVVFLPGASGDKPGSERRRATAHLVRGDLSSREPIDSLASRLGIDAGRMQEIADCVDDFTYPKMNER